MSKAGAGSDILIDGYNLALDKGTGVATYTRNLSFALRDLGHAVSVLYGNPAGSSRDPLLREIAFFDSNRESEKRRSLIDVIPHAILGPLGHRAAEVQLSGTVIAESFGARLPYFDRLFNAPDLFRRAQAAFYLWGGLSDVRVERRPDIAHWTYPLPLRVGGVPNIYTLHDLVPLRLPFTTLDNKRRYLALLRQLARRADHFVTVSECSKRDLVDVLGIDPDRITNTYQSVDIPARYRDKPDEQVRREVEGLAGVGYKNYFLYWGAIEPKKNIGGIIEAYLASNSATPLVVVGARAWKSKNELRLLGGEETPGGLDRSTVDRPGIVRLPYAPFGLLVSLIRGAKAALFPSLYEGFGLPALEAMMLGTPVLCSNTSSLPEVAGHAALMVNPYDTAAITAGIRALDADADLREDLTRRGRDQALLFTPERYRERLGTVYDRFL